jgi:hypothetical protein
MTARPLAVLGLAAAGVLLSAGCSASSDTRSDPPPPEGGPRTIALDAVAVERLRKADRLVLGKIVEVGPSPGVWSGIVATYQPIVLEVERRLDDSGRGWPQPGDRFPVWFGIVGPPDCDPSYPRLDPRIYRIGARGVVGAEFGAVVLGDECFRHHTSARAVTSFHEIRTDADLVQLTVQVSTGR